MTARGARKLKQKLAEKAEEKLRAEQETRAGKIAQMQAKYKDLLSCGKTKEALAYLEQNDFCEDKSEEIKKFKKTLFGYKYLG